MGVAPKVFVRSLVFGGHRCLLAIPPRKLRDGVVKDTQFARKLCVAVLSKPLRYELSVGAV